MDEKIIIKVLSQDHARELFHLTETNRNYLREWLPWLDAINEISETEAFIHSMIEQYEAGGGPTYSVFYEGSMCGVAGFHKIDNQHKSGSIGYWLGEAYVGNGIMTEVVKRLLEVGFVEYHLNKIEIRCAEENTKSRAIPERLNLTHEATLRQCEWLYSRYVNHCVYSILASEYSA